MMEALKARLLAVKDGLSRQSPLTTAIDYTLNHWTGLTLFLEDGRLEPDTNIVERSIRLLHSAEKMLFSVVMKGRRDLGDLGLASQHGKTQWA